MINMSVKKSCATIQHLLLFTFHLLSLAAVATQDDILSDLSPYIKIYKNGTIQRLCGTETVPPSLTDPTTKVHSKDINIPNLVSARIYLPPKTQPNPTRKLPLLVYIHGGAFFTGSAFNPTYHNHLNSLVSEANVVAVSINYRLAPENPLPLGYQDSWRALEWVFSHCRKSSGNYGITEPWLKNYVDCGRVYLGGDSAGGNIAHNMAIRVGLDETGHGVVIDGMFLNCPHFWGNRPIGTEASDPKREALMEGIWVHAYPNSTGFDDPLSNPAMDPNLSKLGCKRVLVYVAEKDILRDRGWYYGETLRKSRWDGVVKVVEVKGEDHVFNLRLPDNPKAKKMVEQLALFLNEEDGRRRNVYYV